MKLTIVDTYANVAMKLVSLPVAHTTTIAGKSITRWTTATRSAPTPEAQC